MIDEATFRRESDKALESLKQSLIAAEDDDAGFEFEDNNGVMNIIFENGSSKFVITPNTPIRQIWISALSTSYKLDWSDSVRAFVLAKTSEDLKTLTQEANLARTLASVQFADEIIVLDSGSTDRTHDIAAQFNATLYIEPSSEFSAHKNAAIEKCTGTWILSLDADEELSPELQLEIQTLLSGHPSADAYLIP